MDVNPVNNTVYLSYEYDLLSPPTERTILIIDGSSHKILGEMDNEGLGFRIDSYDNRFYMIGTDGKFYRISGTSMDYLDLDLDLTPYNLYMSVNNITDTVYVGDRYGEYVSIINDGPRLENLKNISFNLNTPEFFRE
jgi:hypothetical protein